jgi:hypothetical protein
MIANGWHIGVAKTLLFIILASSVAMVKAMYSPVALPRLTHGRPHVVAAKVFLQSGDDYKFGNDPTKLRMFEETEDPIAHLDAALGDTTIPERFPGCDKSLLFALSRCNEDPVATIAWCRVVTSDLLLLAEEFEELELETLMQGTPPHM